MRRCRNVIGRSGLTVGASGVGHIAGNYSSPASLATSAISRCFNATASLQRAATAGKSANNNSAVPTTKAMVTVVGAIHDLSQGFVTMKGPNREISPTRLPTSSPLAGSAASQRSSSSDQGSQESVLQFVVTTNQLGDGSLLDNTPALPPPETSPTESFPPPAAMSVTSFRDACIRKEQFVVRCFGDEEDLSALRLCLLDGSVVRVRGALRLNKQDKELASLPAGAVAGGASGSGSSQNPAARGGLYGRRTSSTPTPTQTTTTPTASTVQSGGQGDSNGSESGSILKKILGIATTPLTTSTTTTEHESITAVPPQVQAPGGDELRYFPYLHVQLPSTKAVEKEEGAALRPLGELTVLHRRP